jgi:hypothetical protein
MTSSATAVKRDDDRVPLAREFATLKLKIAPVEARIDEIKADLKALAEQDAKNFQLVVDGKGTVKVSGPKEGRFQGIFPVVNERVFLDLPDAEQQRLVKAGTGIIKMAPSYGAPFYGRVEFEPFRQAAVKA